MKIIINLFSLILFCNTSIAQQFSVSDYRKELNIKIDVIDEKRLDKGIEIMNDAAEIENEGLQLLMNLDENEKMEGISSNYKKGIKMLMQSSEEYKEGHTIIYTVFNENCIKFLSQMKKMNHYAAGMNKAKYYERKGEKSMEKAIRIRSIILEADKPEWIQYKMHEAIELEKLSIRDKGRALQIYQDFPVEYDYEWENDVTPEELAIFFKDPAINLPPDDIFKRKPANEQKLLDEGPIVFRVQIAAHTIQIDNEFIRTFYTGSDSIIEVHEGKWFKYQIGSFDTFAGANQLVKDCRVPRAFVVAYQDNKKLTIKEALEKIRKINK